VALVKPPSCLDIFPGHRTVIRRFRMQYVPMDFYPQMRHLPQMPQTVWRCWKGIPLPTLLECETARLSPWLLWHVLECSVYTHPGRKSRLGRRHIC
jgi:hypothetical protein